MKRRLLILSAVLVVIFISVSVWHFVSRRAPILEEYGSHVSPEMDFVVELSTENPGVAIHKRLSGFDLGFVSWGMTKSVSPAEWTNHPGFFSVIDDDGRCWAFNGHDKVWIYEVIPSGGRSWALRTWPHEIPCEVRTRLPGDLLHEAGRGRYSNAESGK